MVVGGGEPVEQDGELAQLVFGPAVEDLGEEGSPAFFLLGDSGLAGVSASRQARPSAGSARRSTSPAATSTATCLLTVERSDCTWAASALVRTGPSAATESSSSPLADSTSPPASAIIRALALRTVRSKPTTLPATVPVAARDGDGDDVTVPCSGIAAPPLVAS